MPTVSITIVNNSTVLTDDEIRAVIPAFQAQVDEDWFSHWGNGAKLLFAPKGSGALAGTTWPLYITDTTDVPGAGGYHDDDTGTPEGKVFAKDAMDFGEAWTVDATHELLEMLGDPTTNTMIALMGRYRGFHCLQEVCDACEADRYGYTKLAWPHVLLTDFCLPAYFHGTSGPYDFKGHLTKRAPGLLPGGYLGIELPDGDWTQLTKPLENGQMSRRARRSRRIAHRLAATVIRPTLPPGTSDYDPYAGPGRIAGSVDDSGETNI